MQGEISLKSLFPPHVRQRIKANVSWSLPDYITVFNERYPLTLHGPITKVTHLKKNNTADSLYQKMSTILIHLP